MKKKIYKFGLILFACSIGLFSCEKEDAIEVEEIKSNELVYELDFEIPVPIQIENRTIEDLNFSPSDERWAWTPHQRTMFVAAKHMGLSDTRANRMAGAAHMPDVYDNEGTIPGTQQWRHGYIYLWGVYTGIGVADAMCANNISGSGYNSRSAFYHYEAGSITNGDWYLGYASHYLQDVANPWHTSANVYQQLDTHGPFETWVANNWTSGHKFQDVINSDYYYYSVSNPAATVRTLALWSNGRNTTVSNAYINSGKPTAAGTGNITLVNETKELLKRSCRYTKGLIKYTLDAKKAW
jgi:hypothetical protein